MPCTKQQIAWVKSQFAFGDRETPRERDYLISILASLERLQEHDEELRRKHFEERALQIALSESEPEL